MSDAEGVRPIIRGFPGRPGPWSGDRLPPGQYLVSDFPVLSAGPTLRTPANL